MVSCAADHSIGPSSECENASRRPGTKGGWAINNRQSDLNWRLFVSQIKRVSLGADAIHFLV